MANPKFSKPSKMPCRSWSLEARETCPGAIDPKTKELVDACKGCYAVGGNYRFPNVQSTREHNREDWKDKNWVNAMIFQLDNDRFFRWFDSGDIYHPALAEKIYQVMKGTPWCKHWLPTRSYKIAKINKILDKMRALPNVMVRNSSDSVRGDFTKLHGSTIIGDDQIGKVKGIQVCHAYTNNGKCGDCRACWDKKVKVIAYVQHGLKMKKVNNNIIASVA